MAGALKRLLGQLADKFTRKQTDILNVCQQDNICEEITDEELEEEAYWDIDCLRFLQDDEEFMINNVTETVTEELEFEEVWESLWQENGQGLLPVLKTGREEDQFSSRGIEHFVVLTNDMILSGKNEYVMLEGGDFQKGKCLQRNYDLYTRYSKNCLGGIKRGRVNSKKKVKIKDGEGWEGG